MNNIRIIFWGTPDFALPALEALINNGCNVVAVITNPDEPVGRKNVITPPPVKVLAEKHKIPVFQPASVKDPNFQKEIPKADLYLVAAYGKIIPQDILEKPKYGVLNIHPSLLPRWRGPSPIQYAILNGDNETGVTIMKMDELMDHGPIVAVRKLSKSDFNSGLLKLDFPTLYDSFAKLGAELLIETLPKYINGEITLIPQDDLKATYSKILKKDDGRIDWKKSAEEIERMVRAFNPWPGTWTVWPSDGKIYRIRIEEAEVSTAEEPAEGSAGYVWHDDKNLILIKTGRGSISVKKITPPGKKSMNSDAFLRGHKNVLGSTFI